MIHYIRRIRQKLLVQSAFRRYALYAIGEIALVVVGILLALQINLWNQERELRKAEQTYLTRIHDDIQKMIDYTTMFDGSEEYLVNTLKALRAVENCKVSDEDKPILDWVLSSHQALGLFPVEQTAYDEMLSTGMLTQIQNDTLKRTLSSLYAQIAVSQNSLAYFRDELGRASQVIMRHVNFSIVDNQMALASYDLKKLCSNTEFKNALVEVYDARADVIITVTPIRDQLKTVDKLLNNELNSRFE